MNPINFIKKKTFVSLVFFCFFFVICITFLWDNSQENFSSWPIISKQSFNLLFLLSSKILTHFLLTRRSWTAHTSCSAKCVIYNYSINFDKYWVPNEDWTYYELVNHYLMLFFYVLSLRYDFKITGGNYVFLFFIYFQCNDASFECLLSRHILNFGWQNTI